MGKMIGIDLGTTNSVVAIIESGKPVVLVNQEGERTTPSIVGFAKDGAKLVGQVAKRQAVTNPQNTIYSAKRFIGKSFAEAQNELGTKPYKVVNKDGKCVFDVEGTTYSPEQISSMILAKLKSTAEDYCGSKITEAVITVPAYFNDSQRQATKDAGRIAGLDVKRIINEPTAAALAYGLDKKDDKKIVVFDFGGGTFDVSILDVGDDVVEVKASNGDTHLGGDDFDEVILNWLAEDFKKTNGIDLLKDPMALQRLKEAAEKAKIDLSSTLETEINLPFITADSTGPKHLTKKLTRAQFDLLTKHIIEKSMAPCKQALEDAGLNVSDIDEILMVGGTTRIPALQIKVEEFFKKEINKSVNPDEVVALGAAVQAGVIGGNVKDVLLLDVTPLSLGIETLGGVTSRLVERNTTIPVKKSQVFSTAVDNQPGVNVHVVQGERQMASDNKSLGQFELTGIEPAPRGIPKIEVSFDIDADGILHVSAKDAKTGKEQSIKITSRSNLSDDDIQNMIKDAEINAQKDQEKRKVVDARNKLSGAIYSIELTANEENRKKIPITLANDLDNVLKEAKGALASDDLNKIEAAEKRVSEIAVSVNQSLYEAKAGEEKKAADAGGNNASASDVKAEEGSNDGSGSEDKKDDEDVVDASFKDVK